MDDTVTCALSGMFIAVCAAIGKDRSEMAAQNHSIGGDKSPNRGQ